MSSTPTVTAPLNCPPPFETVAAVVVKTPVTRAVPSITALLDKSIVVAAISPVTVIPPDAVASLAALS